MENFDVLDNFIERMLSITSNLKETENFNDRILDTLAGKLTISVINGNLNGMVTLVGHKSNLIFGIMMVNNLIEGQASIYHSSKDLAGTAEYKHGKRVGKMTLFFGNGLRKEETNYSYDKPGSKEGLQTLWFYNRQIESIVNYHNNQRVGQYIRYNSDGDVIEEGNYAADGKKEGLWMEWYRTNFPKSETFYINGQPHGLHKLWNEHGKISQETTFGHGVTLEERIYHENEKLQSLTKYDSGEGEEISYEEWDKEGNPVEQREKFPGTTTIKRQIKYENGQVIMMHETSTLLGTTTVMKNGITKVTYGKEGLIINDLIKNVLKELYQAANDPLQENRIQILERSYQMGLPIPVFPHEQTILSSDESHLSFFRTFTIDKSFHGKYHGGLKEYESDLIQEWIYGNFGHFNLYFNDRNMNKIPKTNSNRYEQPTFRMEHFFWSETFDKHGMDVYSTLRNSILNAPPLPHKVYSWRGVTGFDELCESGYPSDLIIFNRLLASSFAFEIACSFGGEICHGDDECSPDDQNLLFLIELPAGTNALDLTSVKRSEQEILLPDRSVFQIIRRIPNYFCAGSCREILHIRLIGLAAPYEIQSDGEIEQPQGTDRIKYEIMYDTPEKYNNIFFY